ncbi:MAG: ABC transporter permease subunit [Coprobacillus sp.]
MNVLKFELKRYIPSSLIWALSLTFFGVVCIQLYVSFSSDMNFFESMLKAYSPETLKALGAELSTINTLTGFYGFCFMYVMVAAAFQAMYLGIHVVGKEMSLKTADFLYTKPISHISVLTQKIISVLICLLIMNIIYCIGTYLSALMTNLEFDTTILLTMNASMFLTQLLFFSIGFLLGCVIKKVKTPLTLTTGIVCSFFLLQMIVNLEPDGILSYFSLLSYLSAESIMSHGGFDMIYLCILSILSIGSLVGAYYYFNHRDIQAL